MIAQSNRYSNYNQFNSPIVNYNTFTPKQVQVQSPNTNIMRQSLQRQEERKITAYKYIEMFDSYALSIFEKINVNDSETMNWFKKIYSQYKDEIDNEIKYGNYNKAGEKAIQYRSELIRNSEIHTRIKKWEDNNINKYIP